MFIFTNIFHLQILPMQGALTLDPVRYVVRGSSEWKIEPLPRAFAMTTNLIERQNRSMKQALGGNLLPMYALVTKLCEIYDNQSTVLLADWIFL